MNSVERLSNLVYYVPPCRYAHTLSCCMSRFRCTVADSRRPGFYVLHEVGCVWDGLPALRADDCCFHVDWHSVWYCQSRRLTSSASQTRVTSCRHRSVLSWHRASYCCWKHKCNCCENSGIHTVCDFLL